MAKLVVPVIVPELVMLTVAVGENKTTPCVPVMMPAFMMVALLTCTAEPIELEIVPPNSFVSIVSPKVAIPMLLALAPPVEISPKLSIVAVLARMPTA
jgi:hypothetical protein